MKPHMKHICHALLACSLMVPGMAIAAQPSAVEIISNAVEPSRLIIHERDLKTITVYQWERDGKLLHAWPDQKADIPYDASRVDVKLYNFPTGQFRKLFYPTGTRTAWHENESDLIFYSLGAHQVEFLGDQVFDAWPGDATLHPAGTRHHSETTAGGWKAEIAFDPQGKSGVDLVALPGRGMAIRWLTEQVEGGKRIVSLAARKDGPAVFTAKSFNFPGYVLVEAHYPKGEAIAPYRSDREQLAYVVSGRLKVTSDTVTDELGPGDMVRIAAGKMFARTALEDSVVVEVDGSKAPR